MKLRSIICLAALCVSATTTLADPCVTDTFDRPLDGAIDVTAYVSDVPSVQFPAFWQEGTLEGYRYKMFASAEATLRPTDPEQDWTIAVICDVGNQQCAFTNNYAPPADAIAAANVIGQCLLGANIEVVADAQAAPQMEDTVQTTEIEQVAQIADTPDPATCGSESVNEATDVATMQRLLVMAGEDPGAVDGFLGPKSFAAMEVFVKSANWDTSVPDVIALLDARLCGDTN